MSKIRTLALISPFDQFRAFGLRSLSAWLRAHGIATNMIFLPVYAEFWQLFFRQGFGSQLTEAVCEDLRRIVRTCDAVGISLMTMDRQRVELLCKILAPLGKPIVLGGVHPTCFPEDSLRLSNIVNVGEGYDSLLAWCKDPSKRDIPNLWFREKDQVIRNPVRPAFSDLDRLPFPDFGLEGHFVLNRGRVRPLTESLRRRYLGRMVQLFATIGCPFSCSFCINNRLKDIGPGYGRFRAHGTDYVIGAIKHQLALSPDLETVNFPDDGFICLKEEVLEELASAYKRHIDLPFSVMGVIPEFLTKRKLDILVQAGLKRVRAGFQSGSPQTLQFYRRPGKIETYRQVHTLLQTFKRDLVFPYYDIISDNPLVDEEEDTLASIRLLRELEGRFTMFLFSLRFYPGTQIYAQAQEKQVDQQYYDDSNVELRPTLLNFVLTLIQCGLRRGPVTGLLWLHAKAGNIAWPRSLFWLTRLWWITRCGLEHIRKGDVGGLPRPAAFVVSKILRSRKKRRAKSGICPDFPPP